MSDISKFPTVNELIFREQVELLPGVDELFELNLAYWEYLALEKETLLERTAYIKSYNNQLSRHFLLYSNSYEEIHSNRIFSTPSGLEEGQFSTGYATHGLFPYRGKFHPQLIKAIINVLGVKPGEIILDPMAGSGTSNIEAALLGINSYAMDISPFCQFMINTKYEALTISPELFDSVRLDSELYFELFMKGNVLQRIENSPEIEKRKIYHLAFLAFLDALGYSKRVSKSSHKQLFDKVLKRYVETVRKIIHNQYFEVSKIGTCQVIADSEALDLKLQEDSIDCVITSPPYSFAIDYIENDKDQLNFLGYNTSELRQRLIGLKGKTKQEKIDNYFNDMDIFCSQVSKVLKRNKHFVIIIGSNTKQTGGIRLEETIISAASKYHLKLIKSILKPIKGMRNTMKDEYILVFVNEK
jgi:DNA modification methylase